MRANPRPPSCFAPSTSWAWSATCSISPPIPTTRTRACSPGWPTASARARDFGFSKTPEETMAIWDHDAILADVVEVYRRFRPDVVITRFPPEDRDTHGHHIASAMLAVEAFKVAKEARPKRVVWNRFNFGGPPPKPEELVGFVKLDVGGFDAVRGESFGEMAARSRSMHKSQGFGVAPNRGEIVEWFKPL